MGVAIRRRHTSAVDDGEIGGGSGIGGGDAGQLEWRSHDHSAEPVSAFDHRHDVAVWATPRVHGKRKRVDGSRGMMDLVLTPGSRLVARADVLGSSVGDEASILLDPVAGRYFTIEGAGTSAWAALAVPVTFDALCARVTAEFDVDDATCERDMRDLVTRLIDLGLVRVLDEHDAD